MRVSTSAATSTFRFVPATAPFVAFAADAGVEEEVLVAGAATVFLLLVFDRAIFLLIFLFPL